MSSIAPPSAGATAVDPNDLMLYARVVEEGSFSRAGDRLGLPKSTVSRRVAALEAALGERLLLRTTRKLTVTEFGQGVLVHARQVAQEVAAARELAQHRQAEPSGRLRVSMPSDFANLVIGSLLADFARRHPAITLDLDLSARRVDLIGENFDLAVRMGDLPDDASLAARRIGEFGFGLFAAPSYLARHGTPQTPEQLAGHEALVLQQRNGQPLTWRLQRGERRWEGLPRVRAMANSPELLIRLACGGAGITAVPLHVAELYAAQGALQPVLAQWRLPSSSAWAVFPGRRLMPARTRVFLDAMVQAFDSNRCRAEANRLEAEVLGLLPEVPPAAAAQAQPVQV